MLDALAHPFVRHALIAGTAVAVCAGLVGWFLVLRSQVFSADALSHVAFTGALAALAFGLDVRLGLFAATLGVALVLGLLGPRGRADDVVIGSVFAWVARPRGAVPVDLHHPGRGRQHRWRQRAVRLDLRTRHGPDGPDGDGGRDRRGRAGLAVGSVWIGLAVSWTFSSLPPSFAILAVATSAYAAAWALGEVLTRTLPACRRDGSKPSATR